MLGPITGDTDIWIQMGRGPSQETQTSGFRWGGPITGDPDIWIQMGQGPSQETKTSGFRWGRAHHRRQRHLDSDGAGPSQETQTSGFRWGGAGGRHSTGSPGPWLAPLKSLIPSQVDPLGSGVESKTESFRVELSALLGLL